MNRLAKTICILGVAAAGFTPVLLYAKQDGRSASVGSGASAVSNPEAVTVAVWTPPARAGAAQLVPAVAAPLEAVYTDALPATYEGDYDDPIWAVVTRGARLHSDPDVSSPTTWFYAIGSKLHVVGYRGGWYQVVDPESSRRGFIYARHYLDALRGPDAELPVVAKTETPVQTALAEPAETPKPAVQHASRAMPLLLAPAETAVSAPAPASVRSTRPAFVAARPGSVTSLLNQAIRR
jgi:hypothetical protein